MLKNFVSIGLGLSFIYPLLILPSCSNSHNQALRAELSGRGPLTLDLNNPYLAPNKFLSEEAKDSETLKGFLSLKGAPGSLEFDDPIIGRTSLKLVYKSKNEFYNLEAHGKEWIITGPFTTSESETTTAKNSSLLDGSENLPALLPIGGATTEDAAPKNETPQAKLPESPKETEELDNSKREGPPSFKDIYHEVSFPGQTISFLSHWYTGNISNGDRIRRINSSLSENLKPGDILRIPSYIAQKENPPSEADLQKFITGK